MFAGFSSAAEFAVRTLYRAHPASIELRAYNGSSTHDCALEAARTQGRFSLFQGVAQCDMNDFSV
jgi:hypothetical protein